MADISITAANVQRVNSTDTTQIAQGVAGATITAGQVLYIDAATNTLKLAQATVLASSQVAGIALHGAASGQPVQYAYDGELVVGGTLALGTVYVLSANAGGIAPSADLDTSSGTNYGSLLGIAKSATTLILAIANSSALNP